MQQKPTVEVVISLLQVAL